MNPQTAEQMLLNSPIWLSGPEAKKQIIALMEAYAAQEKEKLLYTGEILAKAYYRITSERDKAAELLLSAYQLVCRANEFMYTDGTSISDSTSRDLYHFVLNDGPVIEELLHRLGQITEDQMTKNQNLHP